MNVTFARIEDLEDLLELISEYQEESEAFEEPADEEQAEAYLREIIKNEQAGMIFIGRTSSGQPVGFITVCYTPSTLHASKLPMVLDLFVVPDMREKGFGHQLFDHTVRWAKSKKYKKIIWHAENQNLPAQYLFDHYDVTSTGWLHYSLNLDTIDR